jgi:ATP-binding cassette subfamily C protein
LSTQKCTIKTLFSQLLSHKKEVVTGNIIAILSTLILAFIPLVIPVLIDELLLGKEHGFMAFANTYLDIENKGVYVVVVMSVIVVLRLIAALLEIQQVKIFVAISKSITYDLRASLLAHLKKISLKEFEMMRVGAVTSKLVTDIETIDGFVSSAISKLVVSVLLMLFSAIVLFGIHWQLALFILITNPIVILFTVKMSKSIGALKKEENKAVELFQSALSETLELFHQIRAANKEEYFFEESRAKAETLKEHAITYEYKSNAAQKYSSLIFLTGYEVFRALGIFAVLYSDLSVGLMLAIFTYLWVMVGPTHDIINFQYVLSSAKAACQRIETVFEMEQEPEISEHFNPFIGKDAIGIEVKNLSFSYHKNKNILSSVNMSIKEGSKVAIVGASGSGKTTLSNILVGFYPLNEGEIFYAGVSNKALKLSTIRENIYLILQHPKLFNDTMRFNLTLGKPHSDEAIKNALHVAQLDDVIERLDLGLETLVGRDGIKFSGGQRQRVAIARMILSDPKVVIFDESTSALDVHTEVRLFGALQDFLANKTVITIAHRLSTIKSAEYIYVLEDGVVVDSGSPKELLEKDQSYFSSMV